MAVSCPALREIIFLFCPVLFGYVAAITGDNESLLLSNHEACPTEPWWAVP